ncbi:MAG: hypothetical protein WA958_06715 [Tunicatimonas sp.]
MVNQEKERSHDIQSVDPMQLELLEMFRTRQFSKQELIDIKQMISEYFFEKADDAVNKAFEEKGWDVNEKVAEWGKGHYRASSVKAK